VEFPYQIFKGKRTEVETLSTEPSMDSMTFLVAYGRKINAIDFCKSQCCGSGCLSRIGIFSSRIPDLGSRFKKIPDPGSASALKNLSIFNPVP
jgi:hypothetical protein